MKFDWNTDTIRWYQEANAYSHFFKHIAQVIAPMLTGYRSLCDIGCGLGLIDLELSAKLEQITCIDINENAIAALNKNIAELRINNIETRQMDCSALDRHWDVIYTSFFGSRTPEKFLPFCKKHIAVVGKKDVVHPFFEKHKRFQKNTCDVVEKDLNERKIDYRLTDVAFEFGQPLRSLGEGKAFFRNNYPDLPDHALDRFFEEQIVETKEALYPFYLPKMKRIGIFEIKGQLQ